MYNNKDKEDKNDSVNDELDLILAAKQRDSIALNKLIESNKGFILSIVKKYHYKELDTRGLGFEDLIQEGKMGLMEALFKFDETKGVKFLTYATYWIKESIFKAIRDFGGTVRLEPEQYKERNKIRKAREAFLHRYEREPAAEELSEETGISYNVASDLLISLKKQESKDASTLSNENDFDNDDFGYDSHGNNDSDNDSINDSDSNINTYDNNVSDYDSDGKDTSKNEAISTDINNALFSILDERERNILKMLFGIDSPKMNLKEISIKLNLSYERVRQLSSRAIKRIKKRDKTGIFEKYYPKDK